MTHDPVSMSPFDTLVGVEWLSDDPDEARARVEVREELKQPYGTVHGGVYSAIIDGLCSRATTVQVIMDGMVAFAQSLDISFLRPITGGTITVTARVRHRGRTTWVWGAEATDDQGRLCVLAKMTIALRPLESPG